MNQEGCYGRRPLHEASRLGKGALVTLLLEARAQLDPRSHYGLTPLALAAQGGHTEVVETLLKRGEGDRDVAADDNILTTEQLSRCFFFCDTEALITYFILSQWFKHNELFYLTLTCSAGADVLSQAQDDASVLYEASSSGEPAVIKLLLEYGADANEAKHTGHMPIHRVAHRGHLQYSFFVFYRRIL